MLSNAPGLMKAGWFFHEETPAYSMFHLYCWLVFNSLGNFKVSLPAGSLNAVK